MDKKYKIFIAIGIVLYVVYHIGTLVYSPIPWFDEADYANITESFIRDHTFTEMSRNISWEVAQLDLAYGPVYFIMQSALIKVFGFTIFSFRFTNLFFGLLSLVLIYRICRHLRFSDMATVLVVTLVALDPQFNQFLHSGRPDLISLSFCLGAYLLFVHITFPLTARHLFYAFFAGSLLGWAFLTNPRILFSFSFYLFYFIYEVIESRFKNLLPIITKYLVAALAIGLFLGLWVFIEFGSVQKYIYETYTNSPIMHEHVGFSAERMKISYNLVMFIYALVCFVILLLRGKLRENLKMVLFALPPILVFMFLVSGGLGGRYYGVIVPFVTILFVGATVNAYKTRLFTTLNWSLAVLFCGLFLFKGAYVFATMGKRDPAYYTKAVAAYIPEHATVAGDFQYYWILKTLHCRYQALEENGTFDQKVQYYQKNKYDYFIINKDNAYRTIYEKAFLGDYKLVGTIEEGKENEFFSRIIRKLPYKITESYACYIYKYEGANSIK